MNQTSNGTVTINGKEFTIKETETEIVLSAYFGKMLVENVFKKDISNDELIQSSLRCTLKTALNEYIDKHTKL